MGPQFTLLGHHGYWSVALLVLLVVVALVTGVVRRRHRNDHDQFVESFLGVKTAVHLLSDQQRPRRP